MTRLAECFHRFSRRSFAILGITMAALVAALAVGCGGSGTTQPSYDQPLPGTTSVQVNLGDAPADWLLAFSMQISSMTLNHTSLGAISVSNAAAPVELISRLGTMEPIAIRSVYQGTYSGASMTIASCTFSYLDPITKKLQQKTLDGPFNVTIPFSSNVVVDTTPLAFNFDLDLLHSLSGDTGSAFKFTPQFHFSVASSSTSGSGSGSGNAMNARHGGMYQMMGVLASAPTSGEFSLQSLESMNTYTIRVNEQTRYQGKVDGVAQLAKGMGVLVTASLQSDGSLLASRIRATMSAAGAMGGGVIIEVSGMPATQLTLVMQNGAGASINTDYLSKTLTVNLTESTTYEIDSDRVDLRGLPFEPLFDASNIHAGQSVLPLSEDGITAITSCDPTCGSMTASTVRLRERGFRGTTDVDVVPGATTSFVLKLPDNCAFTTLTGATEVLIYQQAATNVEDQTTITGGTTLRVHGLPFKVGTQWVLVASTISSN